MTKKRFIRLGSLILAILLILSASGCALKSYSVEELKAFYPKAILERYGECF